MPYRGMRVARAESADAAPAASARELNEAIERECAHYALVMSRGQFFTHTAAAVLWKLPVPISLLYRCVEDGIDVGVFHPGRTPRGSRIHGHKVLGTHAAVRELGGISLTSPASTWAALAAEVRDVHELVALADAVVREPMFGSETLALASRAELSAAVAAGRRPGIARLREALPLVRTRSASRPESLLRLLIVEGLLPEPEANHPIRDERGEIVAWGDLVFPVQRVVVEFEGDHHRTDGAQWAKDIMRQEMLERLGWTVVRVTGGQLANQPGAVLGRIRRALMDRS